MIFVTVGTQLPFERLIEAVADWSARNPGQRVIAQTGETNVVHDGVEARPFVDADAASGAGATSASSPGHGAPSATQRSMAATCSGGSGPSGGMPRSSST